MALPLIPIAIAAGSSILSGILGSQSAAKQANAANYAANLQYQSALRGQDLSQQQYDQSRTDLEPWRQAGGQAVGSLSGMLGRGEFDSSFNPAERYQQSLQGQQQYDPYAQYQQSIQPLDVDVTQDPGYQFRLQQGQQAIEGGAAASGGLFSGQTGKDLMQFGQELGSQEYQNAYNRAAGERQFGQQAFGQAFGQDMSQRQFGSQEYYNALQSDAAQKQNLYNMLAGVAGTGQTATQFGAGLGQQAAGAQGQYGQQAAAAQGAGAQQGAQAYSGAAQNWGNQLTGLAGTAANYYMMQNLLGK